MTTYIPAITLPGQIFAQPALSIMLPITLGLGVGALVGRHQTEVDYKSRKQPPFSPPPWVFGPAWTVLYGLMGYSAYRAWTTGMTSMNPWTRDLTQQGATLYTIQLALNLTFMPIFFGFKRPIEGLANIVALTGTVGYLTYIWGQVDVIAGWVLVPYFSWLSFATYLAAGSGYLNNWDFSSNISKAKKH